MPMTKKEYNELKKRAHEMMLADYEWILQQDPQRYQWTHTQCWLIEFVHDVRDIASLKSISVEEEVDLCDAWHDAHFRPLSLQQLYKDICGQVGIPVPQHPANALSKLRSMEQRCRIFPDSITLFYMKEMQKNPPCRIIELLLMMNRD